MKGKREWLEKERNDTRRLIKRSCKDWVSQKRRGNGRETLMAATCLQVETGERVSEIVSGKSVQQMSI